MNATTETPLHRPQLGVTSGEQQVKNGPSLSANEHDDPQVLGSAGDPLPYPVSPSSNSDNNDKPHHKKSGGFVNPRPSFRTVTRLEFMMYAARHWNRKASKVPPQADLYIKVLKETEMAWDRIRNPPADRVQATWCYTRWDYLAFQLIFKAWPCFIFSANGWSEYPYGPNLVRSVYYFVYSYSSKGVSLFNGLVHRDSPNLHAGLLRFLASTSFS